ncbi:unnamed protein product [Mytilus edulis]|uniref:CCHC-type domain-containing protein n=1 Tax=Mytilus edulis TaxID=6550 RepID=A0A8S3TIJ5_MYTED|nr:unnamed protein product [Mytilus edulis]
MDPMDIETNVKRIVGEEIQRSQNDFLSKEKGESRKIQKKRSTPYSRPSTSVDNGNNSGGVKSVRRPGVCYNCYKPGHWQFECPEKNKKLSTHSNLLLYNDVYRNSNSLSFFIDESLTLKTANLNKAHLLDSGNDSICLLNREECVDQLSRHLNTPTKLISPVGKLSSSIHKWKQAGATDYILQAYTDASDIGFGGFVVPAIDSNSAESVCDSSDVQMNSSLITPRNSLHTVVGSWADHERIKSSTWRELEAVNRTVKSSLHLLKNQTLQINTDNKNVTSIVKNGSDEILIFKYSSGWKETLEFL